MKKDMIYKELIQLDLEVNNTNDFFKVMANKLEKLGYVENTFLEAIMTREKNYPTALPTQPFAVAIPHADPEHIAKPFISVTRLKNSIKWCEMATNDVWHDVKFVFMLGFKHEDDHVSLLQVLIDNFQNPELMEKFVIAKNEEEFKNLILSMHGMND